MVVFAVRRKCIGCGHIENWKELVIVYREYSPRVDYLFVLESLSDIFEGDSSKVEGGSLGLARGRVVRWRAGRVIRF